MTKIQYRLIALSLIIGLIGLITFAPGVLAKKQPQKKKSETTATAIPYQQPTLQVTASPTVIAACAGQTAQVRLTALATYPNGTTPIFHWSATGGRITGEGTNPVWDLTGVQPGLYKASVEMECATNCVAFAAALVTVRCTPPPAPVCPQINVSCPDRITAGEPLTFSASFAGGTPAIPPTYNWSLSSGRIIGGDGTNVINVDTAGLAGQAIRATLTMPGYGTLNCSASCVVQLPPELSCKKFDEFSAITRNDEKARLDNYAIALQNDPGATAYVIVYPGQRVKTGEIQEHITRVVDYLSNLRGIDKRRVVTVVGPTRNELGVELWNCPQGAKSPVPHQ